MPAKGIQQAIGAEQSLPLPMAMTMPMAASTPLLGSSPRKDIDLLVQEIKENLKLGSYPSSGAAMGASPKAKGSLKLGVGRARTSGGVSARASPYAVPPTSRVSVLGNCDSSSGCASAAERQSQLRKWNHQRRRYPSTCKAATQQQADAETLDDPFEMLQELLAEGSLVKEAVRRLQLGLSPKLTAAPTTNANRSFYDSDDECRTPPAYPELCEVGGGMI